jgi:hypothetical protein
MWLMQPQLHSRYGGGDIKSLMLPVAIKIIVAFLHFLTYFISFPI